MQYSRAGLYIDRKKNSPRKAVEKHNIDFINILLLILLIFVILVFVFKK